MIADTLSRAPAGDTTKVENLLQDKTRAYVNLVLERIPATEQRQEEIRRYQESDEISQAIAEFCKSGVSKREVIVTRDEEVPPDISRVHRGKQSSSQRKPNSDSTYSMTESSEPHP